MRLLGIVLIILGIVGLAYGGVTWTREKKVVDLGSVQITHDEHERVPIPPLAGGVALAAGVVLVLADGRRGVAR